MNGTPTAEGTSLNKTARTFLSWFFMIFVAVVLWQLSRMERKGDISEVTYTEFLELLQQDKIRVATIESRTGSGEVGLELRDSSRLRLIIAKEVIPDVTKLLTEKGVVIQFREGTTTDTVSLVTNLAPILLFVGLWIFMIRQMQKKKGPEPPGSGGTQQ